MNSSIPSSKFNPGFYCPTARVDNLSGNFLRRYAPPTHFNFRLKNSVTLALRQKLLPAYSSKINPPSEASDRAIGHRLPASASKINPSEGSDGANGEGTQGPPFLTILAGFLVFLAVCWVIRSFALWLIGLFVRA